MGDSVLRYWIKPCNVSLGSVSKGNGVNIPQAGYGCHGNVCELGDTSACLWKSYLFFLKQASDPEIGLSGAEGCNPGIVSCHFYFKYDIRSARDGP